MTLEDLGWSRYYENFPGMETVSPERLARVTVENKTNYILSTLGGEISGILRGKTFRAAKTGGNLPKVGDWVITENLTGESKVVITEILPRKSQVSRKGVGKNNERQIIATNIDILFIVQSLDKDFNLRKLERYLVMAKEGSCEPVVILNKSDASLDIEKAVFEIKKLAPDVPVFALSARTGAGMEKLQGFMGLGITVAFVGSSGVGKSSLINTLMGRHSQKTAAVRVADNKGRHTTTKRELVMMPSGGMLIDTPGMRELSLLATEENLENVFTEIENLALQCEYNNCDHVLSSGCAVLAALKNGSLSRPRYNSFLKLQQDAAQSQKVNYKSKNEPRSKGQRLTKKDYKKMGRREY